VEPTVQTGRTVVNNKPDSIMCCHKQGICMSIDVAISADRNVIKKQAENILKYEYITIEIQWILNVKVKVMPVITGATGTITRRYRLYLNNIAGKYEIKELQKPAILRTAHKLQKVLM